MRGGGVRIEGGREGGKERMRGGGTEGRREREGSVLSS